jgi:hypothetical protein
MLFFRPVPSTTSRYMHKLPPATINRSKTVPAKSQMYLSLLRSYMVKSNDIIINISVGFGLKSFKMINIDIYMNSFKTNNHFQNFKQKSGKLFFIAQNKAFDTLSSNIHSGRNH